MQEIRRPSSSGFLVYAYLAAMTALLLLVLAIYFGFVPAASWTQ